MSDDTDRADMELQPWGMVAFWQHSRYPDKLDDLARSGLKVRRPLFAKTPDYSVSADSQGFSLSLPDMTGWLDFYEYESGSRKWTFVRF